ncbi:MAG: AAA family ATPase [Candidatus Binatia bacterium]
MLDPASEHPPNRDLVAANLSMPCATAGQSAATTALGEAVAQRQSLILLYGDAGVGKTTLITSFLATIDTNEFLAVHLSATSGEFSGPPSFDALLEMICRRLVGPQPAGQRPATLAVMASAITALAHAGRTVLLAIDHADHLTNNVIAEVTRLGEYLDASSDSFVCIFIGSPTLASRLDAALRRPGVVKRVPEIRVAHPSGEELAALLAYEDTAVPDGPILTPGAIDRIGVYAKANLHWAGPLADAARTLAANQGDREVTPELVRGALLELWPPEQIQPSDGITRLTSNPATAAGNPDVTTMTPLGLSDAPLGSPYGANASVPPVSSSAADPSLSTKLPPGSPPVSERGVAGSRAILIQRPGAVRIALAIAVPLLITGIAVFALRDVSDHVAPPAAEQPISRLPTAQPPDPQSEVEAKQREHQENEKSQINQVPPAEPLPSGTKPLKPQGSEQGQTSSESEPTSDTAQGLETAPATPPIAAPTPGRRASTSKKPPASKALKQDHKQVPSRQWIQTR